MFGKLIKHEFKATARRLIPVLLLMLGMSLIIGFAMPMLQSFGAGLAPENPLAKIISLLYVVAWCVTVAVYIAVGVAALILLIERFNSHVLGNEGYTTMTLPVSVHEILWSKLIVFFVWFAAVSICVLLGILFIVRPNFGSYQWGRIYLDLEDLRREMPYVTVLDLILYALEGLAFVFVLFSSFCLQIYASLMIGQAAGKYKIALAVIVYIILSAVFSTGWFALIFTADPVWDANMEAIQHFMLQMHFHPAILLALFAEAIPGIICYLITAFGMSRHLNLE